MLFGLNPALNVGLLILRSLPVRWILALAKGGSWRGRSTQVAMC
jgi:hypothetical protein